MPFFLGLCWVITALAACFGGLVLYLTFTEASGAPQEAAGAALAVAICIIPYVFTRACQSFTEMETQRDMLAALDSMRDGKPYGTPGPASATEPAPDVIL
jgi:hypothetical protein